MDINTYLGEKRSLINAYLNIYFSKPFLPETLYESIKYSLLSDGKRIRPILVMASYEACGGHAEDILPQAAALELIHTYSLIHDDLPSMDNDDLRRGRPTNHKVFGEAIAILAGDALLTEAFMMLTVCAETTPFLSPKTEAAGISRKKIRPSSLVKTVREIASAAGLHGMVAGQAQDILAENAEPDREKLDFIHRHKTAALITASVRLGPILANAGKRKLQAITRYGENIGLVFQIVDDILNIVGTTRETGKPVGSDSQKHKLTYPAVYGLESARKQTDICVAHAIDALNVFSSEADPLREIAHYLVKRRT